MPKLYNLVDHDIPRISLACCPLLFNVSAAGSLQLNAVVATAAELLSSPA
jgi:hypothetical protein